MHRESVEGGQNSGVDTGSVFIRRRHWEGEPIPCAECAGIFRLSVGSVGQTNAVPSGCATGPGRVHPGFPRAGNEGRPRLHGAWAELPCPRCGGVPAEKHFAPNGHAACRDRAVDYVNVDGQCEPGPDQNPGNFKCCDGTNSHAMHRNGACSHHGGICGGSGLQEASLSRTGTRLHAEHR